VVFKAIPECVFPAEQMIAQRKVTPEGLSDLAHRIKASSLTIESSKGKGYELKRMQLLSLSRPEKMLRMSITRPGWGSGLIGAAATIN
jgi:hypothetical protein